MLRSVIATAVAVLAAGTAPAAVVTKVIDYSHGNTKLKGFAAYDDATTEKRPGVLVVHEWWGLNDYARERCKKLAELGYVAFAVDMYGDGKTVDHPDDARKMATAVRENVETWRGRADEGLKQLKLLPNVDPTKLAAVGYCFGGSTCLQLAYSGADLKAVATFHAALPVPTPAEAKAVKPKLYVAHGADDPFIPPATVTAFKDALKEGKVDFTLDSFPGVVHSFTVPGADKVNLKGMKYDKDADEKSWKQMQALFKDTLGK
jgi:dienelactone hydrolase